VNQSGKKVKDVDLQVLVSHFENYVKVVNLILSRIYEKNNRVQSLGKKLSKYRGRAYNLLRTVRYLSYRHNEEFRELAYERLHRNALEQAGRMLLADWTRRRLIDSAIRFLDESDDDMIRYLQKWRVPSDIVRKVRDRCDAIKKNGAGFHHALGVLRQIRLVIDKHILDTLEIGISWRSRQRKKVSSLLKKDSSEFQFALITVKSLIQSWIKNGYPFTIPQLRNYSLDFSASTENTPGQGYWFTLDLERKNEILLHIRLPPDIYGIHNDSSPYKDRTLSFRFLNWFPRAIVNDRMKAQIAEDSCDNNRAEQLRFRAAMFEDMHYQLLNTIEIQHLTHQFLKLKQKKENDVVELSTIEQRISKLKSARKSAPPILLLRGNKVSIQIPFLAPNGKVITDVLGEKEYHSKAGADRGIRVPVVLSVEKCDEYKDILLTINPLIRKRRIIRKQVYHLQSILERKKKNWDKKRSGQSYPAHILKKDRHFKSLWDKVCRLDREIARLIASKTVWFCESHRVKTLFFEDLRSFQAHAGSKGLSWSLSTNLWGKIIDTVRYMREALGHSKYSVWTVNPRHTSQTCHACGERGVRVDTETSTTEKKGGEYFYCENCDSHIHADINAARNIIHVHPGPSAVSGRTT
jgi:transposase